MAKAEALDKSAAAFDVPDDIFDTDEGPQGSLDDDLGSQYEEENKLYELSDSDDGLDDGNEVSEPEAQKASEESEKPAEPEVEPDLPPIEEPNDPAYQLAQLAQQNAELAARLEQLQRGPQTDPDVAKEEQLQGRVAELRKAVLDAMNEGDEVARTRHMFDLEDATDQLRNHRNQSQIRRLRESAEGQQQQQQAISYAQAKAIQDQTFAGIYRVSLDEQKQMMDKWTRFVQANPAWNQLPPGVNPQAHRWSQLTKALSLVRGEARRANVPQAAIAEGGNRRSVGTSPATSRYSTKELERTAKMMGMSLAATKAFIERGSKGGE